MKRREKTVKAPGEAIDAILARAKRQPKGRQRAAILTDLRKAGLATSSELGQVFAGWVPVPVMRNRLEAIDRILEFDGYDPVQAAKKGYDDVFQKMKGEEWYVFMNHGYLPSSRERARLPKLTKSDTKWQNQIFLYLHLLELARKFADVPLQKSSVLDVGCGRGGGIEAVMRYFNLKRAWGLDLNDRQIGFAKQRHKLPHLRYTRGDAIDTPFKSNQFDVIMNVESSHCYGDCRRFFQEIKRVLKPGALFVLADNRDRVLGMPLLDVALKESGMQIVHAEDITERVRRACEVDAKRFKTVFGERKGAEFPRDIAERYAKIYASGRIRYLERVLRKEAV